MAGNPPPPPVGFAAPNLPVTFISTTGITANKAFLIDKSSAFYIATSAILPYITNANNNAASIDACHLIGSFVSVCGLDDINNWRGISPFNFALEGAEVSRLLSLLVNCGLLSLPDARTRFESLTEFDDNLLLAKLKVIESGAALDLSFNGSDAAVESYFSVANLDVIQPAVVEGAQPAVAYQAAPAQAHAGSHPAAVLPDGQFYQNGPDSLRFLNLCTITQHYRPEVDHPLYSFGLALRVLGPCNTRDSRRDPIGSLSQGALALYHTMGSKPAGTPDAQVTAAILLPNALFTLREGYPPVMYGIALNQSQFVSRLESMNLYVFGSEADRSRVFTMTVDYLLVHYPLLSSVVDLDANNLESRANIVRRIFSIITKPASRVNHIEMVTATEAYLVKLGSQFTQAMKPDAQLTLADIIIFIESAVAMDKAALRGNHSKGGHSESTLQVSSETQFTSNRNSHSASLLAAVRMPSFQDVRVRVIAMPFIAVSQRIAILAIAFKSDSALLRRYLLQGEPILESLDIEFFSVLKQCKTALPHYFGAIISLNVLTGTVPIALANYAWGAAEASKVAESKREKSRISFADSAAPQITLFTAGRFSSMDLINSPGGVLESLALLHKTEAVHHEAVNHYRYVATTEKAGDFLSRLFNAIGYPSVCSAAMHTIKSLFEVFVLYLKEAAPLSGPQLIAHADLCDTVVRECLAAIGLEFRNRMDELAPNELPLDGVLARAHPSLQKLTARLSRMVHISDVQEALGHQPGDKEPLDLFAIPGSSSKVSSYRAPRPSTPHSDDQRVSRRERTASLSPARVIDRTQHAPLYEFSRDRKTVTIGRQGSDRMSYNLETLAKHFGVAIDSKCWTFLLSRKRGAGRNTLCSGSGIDHASDTSPAHVAPPSWDEATVRDDKRWSKLVPAKRDSRAAGGNSRSQSPMRGRSPKPDRSRSRSRERSGN